MSDKKLGRLSDESDIDFNVISIDEIKHARKLADIILKVHGLHFSVGEVLYQSKIQLKEAKLVSEA